jgi:hypothetical protein
MATVLNSGSECGSTLIATPTVDKGGVVLASCRSLGTSLSVAMMASVLLSAMVAAQDAGRWTAGAAMPSERSEVAVAEGGPTPGASYSAANEIFTP